MVQYSQGWTVKSLIIIKQSLLYFSKLIETYFRQKE